jgi:5'-deoxynucleotidase YfbR-like HD superfamily hydrolase
VTGAARLAPVAPDAEAPARLKPLLVELGDLKRVRSAAAPGSTAERLFRLAWARLAAGHDPGAVARETTASALAAARLGDLDAGTMRGLGLSAAEAGDVLARALDEVAGHLDEALRTTLKGSLSGDPLPGPGPAPGFVEALTRQPRAGVTCPGRPRIMLEPPENHAEHCLMVAVYGVVLSPSYGADPDTVFLAGLAHHLHNARMPDSGFTGEMLIEPHLARVMENATAMALGELAPALRARIEAARAVLPDAETPEGQAFHAADVADRVLQIAQHLKAASLTMDVVLGEMELVHDGPVKAFHDRTLREMRIP